VTRTQTSKSRYVPSEFIRTFDVEVLLSPGWSIKSRSEEKRIYGGEGASYRRGKVVIVGGAQESESFSAGALKARLSAAPGLHEETSGDGSECKFKYGDPAFYNGSIAASVVESGNEVIVCYELTGVRL
jgi:hypothetical protein